MQGQPPIVTANETKLTYRQRRDPVFRFGHLPFESQLHDPLIVLDHASDASPQFISSDPNQPFKFFFVRTTADRNGSTERALYSIKERLDGLDVFTIHPSDTAKISWKRSVYAAAERGNALVPDAGGALFNIKRSFFNPPVFSVYRGSRSGQDQDPSDPHSHTPFLRLAANEISAFPTQYKFYGKVMSIRLPTGNAAVDSVLAVERESNLVVLGSNKMREIFVFLRLGDKSGREWKWKDKYAPGQLIATAMGVTEQTTNSGMLGSDIMAVEVAPGVDGRLILAIVLSAITHLQMIHVGVNGTGVAA